MKLYLYLLAASVGLCIPLQAGINSLLRKSLSDPIQAAFISFAVGTVALAGYVLFTRPSWPSLTDLGGMPLYLWTGGLLGAFFVASTIHLAPKLGAGTMTAFILAGQLVASILLDHFGLVGFPEHHVNLWRVLGVGLLSAGVWLIKTF